ncbi:phage holin family protein [Yokenella regensburgei]|uniref:phage holin family protein n=1 Tax=Yokenella regensburgei TaxID=158877 RepID=UPI003ED93606
MNNTIQELAGQIMKWIEEFLPAIFAGVMATVISALMDIRTGESKRRTLTGAFICGLVAMGLYSFVIFLGAPPEAGAFFGAFIGFYGADNTRDLIVSFGRKIATRKIGGAKDANKQ